MLKERESFKNEIAKKNRNTIITVVVVGIVLTGVVLFKNIILGQ